MVYSILQDPPIAKFLFANTKTAIVWFFVRIYVGLAWLEAGWGKLHNDAWVGNESGKSLTGFIQGALSKTEGAHPDVVGWYASFLQNVVLSNVTTWAHAIAWGEFLVGAGLILGALTGVAAFFGLFMNLNFLFAGTVSSNPLLFVLGVLVLLAWKVAGYIGIDYYLLPVLGTPWQPGKLFKK
jgi:thiosulfate dehydrogenase [quinone] large subunit